MGDIGPLWWDNEAFLTTCCSKHSSLWMCQQIHNDILDTIAPFILSFSTDVMQPGCEYWQATPNSRQDLTVQCPVANFLSLQLPLALGPSSLPAALFASCSPCSLPGTLFALLKPPQAVRLWTIAAYDGGREGWFCPLLSDLPLYLPPFLPLALPALYLAPYLLCWSLHRLWGCGP